VLFLSSGAVFLYVSIELTKLTAEESFETILFRRNDIPNLRNSVLEFDGRHPMSRHIGNDHATAKRMKRLTKKTLDVDSTETDDAKIDIPISTDLDDLDDATADLLNF